MKPFPLLLTALALSSRLLALDAAGLAAVTAKFANTTPDEQYLARVELNRVIDAATASAKDDRAAVTQTVVAALMADSTPAEAKKYLLRALARVGTAEAVAATTKLLVGSDAGLKEEARQVLEAIPAPQAAAALAQALAAAKEPREKQAIVNSLGVAKVQTAVPTLAALAAAPEADLARAAVAALTRIGGLPATQALIPMLTDNKLTPAIKAEVERALLITAATDLEVLKAIYQTTQSPAVKVAAFAALAKSGSPAMIESALKSDDPILRQAAVSYGLKWNSPAVQPGLADKMAKFSKGERLTVLAQIQSVKPASDAEKIALAAATSADPDEQIAALNALGKLATKPAFEAALQAIGAREPAINRAAGNVLADMAYPAADAALLALIQGAPGPNKLLALKAAAYRYLPGINPLLIKAIQGPDQDASKEAMKTLYFTATLEDLGSLVGAAKSAADPQAAASLASLCKKIATRLDSADALKLVADMK